MSLPSHRDTAPSIFSFLLPPFSNTLANYSILVTMQWDRRKVYGLPPSGRGYHGAVLHDSRLFIIGGFDGYGTSYLTYIEEAMLTMLFPRSHRHAVFNDTYILELA